MRPHSMPLRELRALDMRRDFARVDLPSLGAAGHCRKRRQGRCLAAKPQALGLSHYAASDCIAAMGGGPQPLNRAGFTGVAVECV